MSDSTPDISVLMPVYNNADYLREAVQSILDQTYSNFEFLIIDDGSKDASPEILADFAKADDRVKVITQENQGYAQALNNAVDLARASLLARMDADDIAYPDRFAIQVAYLEEHPECVACGGRTLFIDNEGRPIREWSTEQTHEEIDAAHLAGHGGILVHPAAMMRRSAVIAVGKYRTEYLYAEDLDFFLRMAENGRVSNVPELVLQYRQHFASIGYSRTEAQKKAAQKALRDAYERRGLKISDELAVDGVAVDSQCDTFRKWSWWALQAGHVETARFYAAKSLKIEPWSVESWRACYCAWRGR
jgi:glycosyltransferase involved in cell wall biosynthesis